MHQSLLAYAGSLNQTSRGEWRKVEGRFQHLRFLEDSRELYALIAEIIAAKRPAQYPAISGHKLRRIADRSVAVRWFDGERDRSRVRRILRRSDPLTAAALQTLPRVVARVGQNERSLFTFIDEVQLDATVGTLEVYGAFSDAMRMDVGIGGTHRRWVETENALSRADGLLAHEALTAACLFQLGTHGERRRLSRGALELALASRHGCGARQAVATVQALIDRKLLIHRRSHDDVSIWCGADVDLVTRIRDFRAQRVDSFDVVRFLDEHRPAPSVRPSRHNTEYGTARYLEGHYVMTSAVIATSVLEDLVSDDEAWGHVLYVLADGRGSLRTAMKRVKQGQCSSNSRLVFVLADEPIPVHDAALEVEALLALRKDDVILGEDPLVSQEIDELLSVARAHLDLVLHRLISERSPDTSWISGGSRLAVTPETPAGVAVSHLMDSWYPVTPIIANDQLMRNKLSRQIRTASVRVILRIMEHGHKARLGYAPKDTSAEASIYRTVLEKTGLHLADGSSGRFASPAEVEDRGLKVCWQSLQDFFQKPATTPKQIPSIIADLRGPPIGLPSGVLPVLVMAAYRAFARAVCVRADGKYVPVLLGFSASSMFVEPQRHAVAVYKFDEATSSYLAEIAYVFAHVRPRDPWSEENVRFAWDALNVWKATVPAGAWRTTHLSKDARTLLQLINGATDPGELFLKDLPNTLGSSDEADRYPQIIATVERVRGEVDGLIEGYTDLAIEIIAETLAVDTDGDPLARVGSWIRCLDVDALRARSDLRITDKTVLRTALDTLNGRYTPQSLARALSSILLQQGVDQWQDSTADRFRLQLRECKQRIEDTALASASHSKAIAPLVHARIQALEQILRNV